MLKKSNICYFNFDFFNVLIVTLLIRLFDDYNDFEKETIIQEQSMLGYCIGEMRREQGMMPLDSQNAS